MSLILYLSWLPARRYLPGTGFLGGNSQGYDPAVNTGVSRKVDDLGRIVLPAELRRSFGLREGAELLISVEEDKIILTPKTDICVFCGGSADLREFRGRMICASCVGDLGGETVAAEAIRDWDPFAQPESAETG